MEKDLKLDGRGQKIVDYQNIGSHSIITVANPHDRTKMTSYELALDDKGNMIPYEIGDVAQLHKLTEKWWYSDTNEGHNELQSRQSNDNNYKEEVKK